MKRILPILGLMTLIGCSGNNSNPPGWDSPTPSYNTSLSRAVSDPADHKFAYAVGGAIDDTNGIVKTSVSSAQMEGLGEHGIMGNLHDIMAGNPVTDYEDRKSINFRTMGKDSVPARYEHWAEGDRYKNVHDAADEATSWYDKAKTWIEMHNPLM